MNFIKLFSLFLCLTLFGQQKDPVLVSERKQHIPYGVPTLTKEKSYKSKTSKRTFRILGRKSYVVAVDTVAKLPVWASYRLRPEDAVGCIKRSNSFAADQSFDKGERAEMVDYAKSGYDIGHMVPCADQSFDEESEKESFLLTNMAPQLPNLNRGSWKKLETYVRYMSWKLDRTLIVYVGAIYADSYKKIGPNGVVVPTAFYKIVTDSYTKKTWAFLFPHKDGIKNFYDQQTTVDDIEFLSGIDFAIADPKLESKILPLIDFKLETPDEIDVDIKAFNDFKRKKCTNWKQEDDEDEE